MKLFKLLFTKRMGRLLRLLLSFGCSQIMGATNFVDYPRGSRTARSINNALYRDGETWLPEVLDPWIGSFLVQQDYITKSSKYPIDFIANATILPDGNVYDIRQDSVGRAKILMCSRRATERATAMAAWASFFTTSAFFVNMVRHLWSEDYSQATMSFIGAAFCGGATGYLIAECGSSLEFLVCDASTGTIESRIVASNFYTFQNAYFLNNTDEFEIQMSGNVYQNFRKNDRSGKFIKVTREADKSVMSIRRLQDIKRRFADDGLMAPLNAFDAFKNKSISEDDFKYFLNNKSIYDLSVIKAFNDSLKALLDYADRTHNSITAEMADCDRRIQRWDDLEQYIVTHDDIRAVKLCVNKQGVNFLTRVSRKDSEIMSLPACPTAHLKASDSNFVLLKINGKNVAINLSPEKINLPIKNWIQDMIYYGKAEVDSGKAHSLESLSSSTRNNILENLYKFCGVKRPTNHAKTNYAKWYAATGLAVTAGLGALLYRFKSR